uniref:Chloroplast protein-transporting ATPase n=1 Tax=Ditylenchus dipsaci TaxID=166011 RepID=A0A915CWD1_9BILA
MSKHKSPEVYHKPFEVVDEPVDPLFFKIKEQYNRILLAQKNTSSFYNHNIWSGLIGNNHIVNWSIKSIEQWAQFFVQNKDKQKAEKYLPEAVAVIIRATELTMKEKPSGEQIISLLVLLNKEKPQGRIIEMGKREEISTISAMLATILALKGEKVDIIYNLPKTAEQDAHKWAQYFQAFSLIVECSTMRIQHTQQTDNNHYESGVSEERYHADILFGDLSSFQNDLLVDEYHQMNTRKNRLFEHAIVMDAGTLLADGVDDIYMLPNSIPNADHLIPLLIAAWNNRLEITKKHGLSPKLSDYKKILEQHLK